jgi:ATPase family AAA domain-containing protein 1
MFSFSFFRYWGDSEKIASAIFGLARKLAPCIIFFDEVDSLLSKRHEGEQSYSRGLKNEFFAQWDGLLSSNYEQVVVLGTTNRPFDLDESALRRFMCRVFIDLPDYDSRIDILKRILRHENTEKLSLEDIAKQTHDYSGSDLRQLCCFAAFVRLKEEIGKKEKKKENSGDSNHNIRPLIMDDFFEALAAIDVSSVDHQNLEKMKKWKNPNSQPLMPNSKKF